MQHNSTHQSGLTIKDLAVLLFLLFLIAVLVIPAFQKPSRKAFGAHCASRARAITAVLRTYAAGWDGWTNPDPCYYVRECGYPLNTDLGKMGDASPWYVPGSLQPSASQLFAAEVNDLRCGLDESPIFNAHGIPTSYQVTAHFIGLNIMKMGAPANEVPAVVEVGLRHPTPGQGSPLGGNTVYADLSCRRLPEPLLQKP